MRFFSSSKWKSSYSFSSNSPPPQEILLVRISSLTKSKTHGNFLGQPVFLFVKEEFLTREKSSWEGGNSVSNEFFSLSKRISSRRKSPHGREEGGGVTRENISKRYSIEVSIRVFSLSMRKPLHSFLLAQGNSPCEDFLFDEEKNSWQHSRTAMSFSLRQRGNSHERKILLGVWGGGVESNEFFSSSKRKSSRGTNPR